MSKCVKRSLLIIAIYLITIHHILGATSISSIEAPRDRSRSLSRVYSRTLYRRLKPEPYFSEFPDDDDFLDLTKRQQSNSDDYGHLRFGKRDEQFNDYGHMRFGRNGRD